VGQHHLDGQLEVPVEVLAGVIALSVSPAQLPDAEVERVGQRA